MHIPQSALRGENRIAHLSTQNTILLFSLAEIIRVTRIKSIVLDLPLPEQECMIDRLLDYLLVIAAST